MLAGLLAKYPSQLRADFQRFYGLNLDGLGAEYTYRHAADLAAHLPQESACVRAQNPEFEWTDTQYLLRSIEFSLRVIVWQNTKDGQKGRRKPKPIDTPAEIAKVRNKVEGTDMSLIAEQLNIEL